MFATMFARLMALQKKLKTSLQFEPSLEERFWNDNFEKSLSDVRVGLWLVIILYALFGVLDVWIVPETKNVIWIIRFIIVIPFTLLVFFFTYSKAFQRYMQFVLSVNGIVVGYGIIAMIMFSKPTELGFQSYYAGLLLAIMAYYTLFRLRYAYATIISLIVVLGYEVVAIGFQNLLTGPQQQIGIPVFLNNNFFFISSLIIGNIAGLTLEIYMRKDFLQRVEIERANKNLKKLDTLKSDFISLVSHELKTPLSAIRTSAEFLESEEVKDSNVEKEMLENIISSVDRLTRLINDILDLSKIEAGKMEFHFEQINFNEIAQVALENIRPLASKKNITISVDIPEDLFPVLGDREKIIIVLNNLLGNALKFTQNEGRILLSAKDYQDRIMVRVEDNGIGIEKDKLVKIFDKFYQVDSTSRRKIGGSGLGLSISSGIIKAHGSEIRVESEQEAGSTFSFGLKKSGKK
ncbi:two-component system, OmpR family, phosphate regulon sensor histidine kinase PhoR [Methanosarcinales archaeon]|nr:two-component system, OmpR family, phosphate regulon sensor histidine kinase PhoR [Methanosarcinales archaeon]